MSQSKKNWGGLLFGLLFLFAGLATAYVTAGSMIYGYIKSSNWVEVKAQLSSLKLNYHQGDDSTTYSVSGTYSYQYGGVVYTSSDISLSKGSDNIGSYWQDLHDKLQHDRSNGNVIALVNPSNPSKSILDRTLRVYSLIFGAVFAFIFGGLGVFIALAAWKGKPSKARQSQHISKDGIPSKEKAGFDFLLGFGAIFFVIGTGIGSMAIPKELAKGNHWVLLILIFAFIGLSLMVYALKQKALFKKFGPTPLTIDPQNPGLGGEFGASLLLFSKAHNSFIDPPVVMSTLRCIRRYRSGKNTSSRTIWEESFPAYTKFVSNGLRISTKFHIPADGRASKQWSDGDGIEWELLIEGDFNGSGYGKLERSWPVFVDAVKPVLNSSIEILRSFVDRADQMLNAEAQVSALEQIKLLESERHIDLISAAGRHWFGALLGIIFGGIFAGVGWFTVGEGWWPGYVFLLIGVLVLLACLYSIGSSISTRLDKHARLIRINNYWFGIPLGHQECAIFSSDQFSLKQTMSTSDGKRTTRYFSLKFEYNGRRFTLAKSIRGKREALALKQKVTSLLFDPALVSQI